jgi:hypothetical protein
MVFNPAADQIENTNDNNIFCIPTAISAVVKAI